MFLLVCSASAVEEKLRNNIMKDYNKKARPVIKETDVVHIFIDIALLQLMKVVSHRLHSAALLQVKVNIASAETTRLQNLLVKSIKLNSLSI
ncbi:unnamed protein product [Pocillopora meandrina]|uniref:Neurotransmitter-gated ion-channel ligand-binding domain-containing protein n=1 Tax=Pocillopora meandrina TaxID=46732 RepID=A0AAU9Y0H5_9CNID|nr:unnamed protein product [Pocillopora meandrina]